ncbi:MAG TPA: histidinol-phosphatase HisJ family protein [Epulopiscium sp.]|nr:histidinol-phosphatase HisJ family protein [Candidatus Epulonipiscium sp.]
MYKADYHTHTELSLDSMAPMEDQVKQAISLGFSEMVITDHHESLAPEEKYFLETDLSDYIKHFNTIKEKYKNQINLKLGAEIGYEARGKDVLDKFIQDNPFEFVICSMHSQEGEDFYFGSFFANKTKKDAFTQYFQAVKDCISEFKNFDVIGHLDFICRYGNYPNHDLNYLDYKEIIDDILKILISNHKGIEMNTSGLRYGVGHMHPRLDIIKRYKELGGEIITIGSDAHTPRDIGADHEYARSLLKEAGFEYFTTFNNRKPEFRKL